MLLKFILAFAVQAFKSTSPLTDGLNKIRDRATAVPLPSEDSPDRTLNSLPEDILNRVMESTSDPELVRFSQVNRKIHRVGTKKMTQRKSIYDQRVAEEAQLVNELERFHGIVRDADPDLYELFPHLMKDGIEEIRHYLNGFDNRLAHALSLFHSESNQVSDDALPGQIEAFALKLAQHRATYRRPPPHRRGNQGEIPLFDAFIRMRDDNMEILQKQKISLMMFERNLHRLSGDSYWEQEAMMKMMEIMEAIGFVIGYPGVQEMQKDGGDLGFSKKTEQKVRDGLLHTIDIAAFECGTGNLVQVLSRNSCIGFEGTDKIERNIREFIRIYSHAAELEKAKLVNELEGFRTKSAPRFNRDFISRMNASEEIEHYLNGFDLRMYEWMMAFHRNSDAAVKQQIEGFATKLAQHRATYPRPPPHRRGQQEEMPTFDAYIKMRDNNMAILQNRMLKDHVMFDYYYWRKAPSLERSAMIEVMWIMETIGIVIGYPGMQKMQKECTTYFSGFSGSREAKVQKTFSW